jgi:hypothetical protein
VLAIQVVETASGTDLTQIFVTLIVTVGVIVTAVLSYLGVKAGREGVKAADAAAEVAARTQDANSADHGKVAGLMAELRAEMQAGFTLIRDEIKHLEARVTDVGQNQGVARDQHIAHQQWHIEHPYYPPKENP